MENNKIKIIFIGTPEFGAVVLEKLINSPYKPSLIITETDKPVGRKQIITPPPVKLLASKYNIPVQQPERIENLKFKIENLQPDLAVVAAYGQILPQEILDIPKYGCLNVHPSLLPKYRGATPIQSAILNGDEETGVSIILMDEKIDHGPIVANSKFKIQNSKFTYEQLSKELAELGANLIVKTIPQWVAGKIKPRPQDEGKASYTKILAREDGKIDWQEPSEALYRKIRALNPWPGVYAVYREKRVKILKARLEKNKLIIEQVQLEGKKPASFDDFKRGHPDFTF